ncbi:MAG TPA: GntR family transcriptional regulator [Verrucomicrobiae bacterium]|nr:GntR family transcriptional regulator [Verrucomicrobiae bacterium]
MKNKSPISAIQTFARDHRESGEHLYRQLALRLGRNIRDGKLKPGQRLPSMDDLATTCGVTKITVRRALLELKSEGLIYTKPAQGTYVSETLPVRRERVRNKVLTVGLISRVLTGEPGPYHAEILASLRTEISKRKGNLVVLPMPQSDTADISEQMGHANLDAVIFLGPFDSDGLRRIVRNGPPSVLVDFQLRGLRVDTIAVDNIGGAETAVNHLLALGHKDIAVFLGEDDAAATRERLEGAHNALKQAGIPGESVRHFQGDFRLDSGYQAMASLLKSKAPPTAVFCMNDEMAVGAIQAVHRLSPLEVPRDISIIGFDDIIWGTTTHPRLTTVRVDKSLIGRLTIERVLSALENHTHTVTSTLLDAELLQRESTAPPARR